MRWKPLWIPLLGLVAGCGYLTDRGNDFADCWRGEVHMGLLPGGWVTAGPVLHTGLAWAEGGVSYRAGYRYNYLSSQGAVIESNAGNVHFGGPFEAYYLVHTSRADASSREHFCYGIVPPLINEEGIHRDWLHDFDVEAGANVFVGLSLGFSVGEFLDFLLGWFMIDLAGDDDPQVRRSRDYFLARRGNPGPILPKKDAAPH
jgi:hypothetical protein